MFKHLMSKIYLLNLFMLIFSLVSRIWLKIFHPIFYCTRGALEPSVKLSSEYDSPSLSVKDVGELHAVGWDRPGIG
jgi:hypothetical protein